MTMLTPADVIRPSTTPVKASIPLASSSCSHAPMTLNVRKKSNTKAQLTWTAVNDDRLVARVYRREAGTSRWKLLRNVRANERRYVDSTRKKGKKYSYRIVLHTVSGKRFIVVKDINGKNVDSTSKYM